MKITTIFIGASLILASCAKEKKSTINLTESTTEIKETTGEDLFNDNNCNSCHSKDTKLVGPSLIDISNKYKADNGNLQAFLKGNAKAIVSNDEGEIATMKPTIDGVTKNMADDDLKKLSDYIINIK